VVTTEWTSDALVLALRGRLDTTSAGPTEAAINDEIQRGAQRLVLDFREVSYVSSAGLRVVLLIAKKMKSMGGRLVLFGLSPSVKEVFAISGFLQILTVQDDRETALASAAA
jgi:anti-anti-sigma factor